GSDFDKDEIKAIISLLNRANGRIKSDVLASTSWYKCPNFTFVNDTSLEKSKHIEDLFAQIRKTKSSEE
ncbi:MAG: ribosome-binding factor A, partial [Aliarcobacter butzleri]